MSLLSITFFHIIFGAAAVIALYVSAIMILYRNKSGFLPYLAVFLFPVLGSVGVILGNFTKRIK